MTIPELLAITDFPTFAFELGVALSNATDPRDRIIFQIVAHQLYKKDGLTELKDLLQFISCLPNND